eukprot:gb/GFBE01079017.1/.p1 GENE.gb/GFBE01079017.1/~~gb/GFBE01079017.1/.p1  ORF type:complete len:339 (+),score=44.24 gb/GFBE01079017.1/:1-1017(+)
MLHVAAVWTFIASQGLVTADCGHNLSADILLLQSRHELLLDRSQKGVSSDPTAIAAVQRQEVWPLGFDSSEGRLRRADSGHQTWLYMHIAKTGGQSLIKDLLNGILPTGDGLYAWEACHSFFERESERLAHGSSFMTLLREPRSHVLSLWHECAESPWGLWNTRFPRDGTFENISLWLEHFSQSSTLKDFNCYYPFNFQSRHFIGDANCHHASTTEPPDLIDVLHQLDRYSFVGVTERYQESLCIFEEMTSGELPHYCDCENKTAWDTFPTHSSTHGVSEHSTRDLTDADLQMIDNMTTVDLQLWKSAVDIFLLKVDKVEATHGTRILCDRQLLPDAH